MVHERGDVPGPGGARGARGAPTNTSASEPVSEPTAVPEAPLGWEQGGQSTDPAKQADPVPGKFRSPSAGETSGDAAPTTADSGNPT